jgi:hypothetical protein
MARLRIRNTVKTYEVDFQKLLAEKEKLFVTAGFDNYVGSSTHIGTDFSLGAEQWVNALLSAGFNPEWPSVWYVVVDLPFVPLSWDAPSSSHCSPSLYLSRSLAPSAAPPPSPPACSAQGGGRSNELLDNR